MSDTLEFVCDICGEDFSVSAAEWRSRTRIVFCPCCGGTFLTRIEDPVRTVDAT